MHMLLLEFHTCPIRVTENIPSGRNDLVFDALTTTRRSSYPMGPEARWIRDRGFIDYEAVCRVLLVRGRFRCCTVVTAGGTGRCSLEPFGDARFVIEMLTRKLDRLVLDLPWF